MTPQLLYSKNNIDNRLLNIII
ncbi:hypothetical protein GMOD_00010431 [Pyrenophora seminiperda CCB06]|uniref:Uncharacterized protein n=1 Tax=Pyrenophora seminiperda CCB06 TaxID=1302712 RepID=A0A3M7M008_9PLEO|nr:hypothetical protein GMOD_00010431 [Pyrenophora seminiperda CCB06]